jgi:hypothetical protein
MVEKTQTNEDSRIFMGSWFLVIAPFFVAVVIVWYNFGKIQLANPDKTTFDVVAMTFEHVLQILIYLVGGEILYYFASRVPPHVAIYRAKKLDESDDVGLLDTIFKDTFKGATLHYDVRDSAGNTLGHESHYVPGIAGIVSVPFKLLVYAMILIVKASLVPYWAIINFFRNYVFVWLFSKKYEQN